MLIVVPSLLALSFIHFAAFLNVVRIPDLELKELFIDSSIYYATFTVVTVVLFVVIHWMKSPEELKKI